MRKAQIVWVVFNLVMDVFIPLRVLLLFLNIWPYQSGAEEFLWSVSIFCCVLCFGLREFIDDLKKLTVVIMVIVVLYVIASLLGVGGIPVGHLGYWR